MAIEAMNADDFDGAFNELRMALTATPLDVRLLQLTGYAALRAGRPHEAEHYFTQALKQKPSNPWPLQLGLINSYAAEYRWQDFDTLRKKLRSAILKGDPLLSNTGHYIIDSFTCGQRNVEVFEYPTVLGPTRTRYRFLISRLRNLGERKQSTEINPNRNDKPSVDSTPAIVYVDLEGFENTKQFALVRYDVTAPQPIAVYGDGEPTYESMRTRLLPVLCFSADKIKQTQ